VKNSLYGRPKSSKSSKIAPGPGAYDPKVTEFVPSYKLSPEIKRSASNMLKVPGPGQYQTENTLNLVSALKKAPTWKYYNN
jgi:cellulose synthase/poly-beta-1,6-N-acetylglucosamine synthase-like glycosyltransferase